MIKCEACYARLGTVAESKMEGQRLTYRRLCSWCLLAERDDLRTERDALREENERLRGASAPKMGSILEQARQLLNQDYAPLEGPSLKQLHNQDFAQLELRVIAHVARVLGLDELNRERDDLRKERDAANRGSEVLRTQLDTQREELARLSEERDDLLKTLGNQAVQMNDLRTELDALRGRNRQILAELSQAKNSRDIWRKRAEDRASELSEERHSRRYWVGVAEYRAAQVRELLNQLTREREKVKGLEAELASLQALCLGHVPVNAENVVYKGEKLEDLKAERDRLREALLAAEEPIHIAATYADEPGPLGARSLARRCAHILPEIRAALGRKS